MRRWKVNPLVLLSVITAVIMAQNYLLVEKTDRYAKRINALKGEVDRLSIMNPGDSLSSFVAMDLKANPVKIDYSGIPGKKVLMVFTTWCGVCKKNMKQWNRMVSDLSRSSVFLLGISPDPIDKILDYQRNVDVQFRVLSFANDSTILKRFKFTYFPLTVLIGDGNKVLRIWAGGLDDGLLLEVMNSVLSLDVATYSGASGEMSMSSW